MRMFSQGLLEVFCGSSIAAPNGIGGRPERHGRKITDLQQVLLLDERLVGPGFLRGH